MSVVRAETLPNAGTRCEAGVTLVTCVGGQSRIVASIGFKPVGEVFRDGRFRWLVAVPRSISVSHSDSRTSAAFFVSNDSDRCLRLPVIGSRGNSTRTKYDVPCGPVSFWTLLRTCSSLVMKGPDVPAPRNPILCQRAGSRARRATEVTGLLIVGRCDVVRRRQRVARQHPVEAERLPLATHCAVARATMLFSFVSVMLAATARAHPARRPRRCRASRPLRDRASRP